MDNITIGQIVGAISSISIIIGFIVMIYNLVKKSTLDRIKKNEDDIKELKKQVELLNVEVQDSKEERLILIKAQLACLKGLKELKANGPVTKAIGDIEEYLVKKSHD